MSRQSKILYEKMMFYVPDQARKIIDQVLMRISHKYEKIQTDLRLLKVPCLSHVPFDNLYHCCVHKTASRWFKNFFSDPLVYQYSGLKPFDARWMMIRMTPYNRPQKIETPFPKRTFVTGLYINYDNFQKIPKFESYKVIFMFRDPRDIVVSSYYSLLYSHNPMGEVLTLRKKLQKMSKEDGLIFVINYWQQKDLFEAICSWTAAVDNPRVLLVRFEDFVYEYEAVLRKILLHFDISMPMEQFVELAKRHSFERLRGENTGENVRSHYRKGKPGDWKNHFTSKVEAAFNEVGGNLIIEKLGYI